MTIIETIADLIRAAAIPEITGGDNQVFQFEMPDSVTVGVMVIPVMGSFLVRKDTPGYFTGEFMVIIRHSSTREAIALSELVYNAVDQLGVDTTDHEVKMIRPVNKPFPFPRSEGDRYEVLIQGAIAFAEK